MNGRKIFNMEQEYYRKGGMGRNAINKVINKKVDDFTLALSKIGDIKDEDKETFREEIKNNLILSGGCIASMLLGEKVNDFDFYFLNKDIARKVINIYISKIKTNNDKIGDLYTEDTDTGIAVYVKSAGIISSDEGTNSEYEYFENSAPNALKTSNFLYKVSQSNKKDYELSFMTANAITLVGGVQLIIRFVGDPEYIHKRFDFTHAKNYWIKDRGVVLNPDALESILSKRLKYSGSMYPICSLLRIRKFIKRGWHVSAGEILKISYDISHLDLSDYDVLKDQLAGVDVAYFAEFINELIAEKNNGRDIDHIYICNLLDKVFG